MIVKGRGKNMDNVSESVNSHEDVLSESPYRYDDFLLHCSNILEGLVIIGKEVNPMLINKLTKQDQNKFTNTYSKALNELQKTLHPVILRKRRNEQTPEWFFQTQRKKLQKIDEELVPILHDLKFQLTDGYFKE